MIAFSEGSQINSLNYNIGKQSICWITQKIKYLLINFFLIRSSSPFFWFLPYLVLERLWMLIETPKKKMYPLFLENCDQNMKAMEKSG